MRRKSLQFIAFSIAWDFHLEAPIELEKRQLPISPQIVWESHILTVRIIIRDFSVLSVSSYNSIADLDITKFLLQYIMILGVRCLWVLVGRPANKQWGSLSNTFFSWPRKKSLSNTGEHDARIKIKVTPQSKVLAGMRFALMVLFCLRWWPMPKSCQMVFLLWCLIWKYVWTVTSW